MITRNSERAREKDKTRKRERKTRRISEKEQENKKRRNSPKLRKIHKMEYTCHCLSLNGHEVLYLLIRKWILMLRFLRIFFLGSFPLFIHILRCLSSLFRFSDLLSLFWYIYLILLISYSSYQIITYFSLILIILLYYNILFYHYIIIL